MDAANLLEKVAAARSAILDRIEDSFGDALGTLSRLQKWQMSKMQTVISKVPFEASTHSDLKGCIIQKTQSALKRYGWDSTGSY
jgi:hypothetical protein